MEQTELYRGYTIEIKLGPNDINPLHEWDTVGTFSCWHSKYDLSSKHSELDDVHEDIVAHVKRKDVVSLPIYLYDHGGITISTTPFSCKWDSGLVGYIHATKEEIRRDYGWKAISPKRLEQVKNWMKGLVETVDWYLRGEVYSFRILAPNGEEVDSCGGYFGYDHEKNGILPECRSIIDALVRAEGEEWEQGAPPPGWICTDPDNMQFAKQVNETTWTYRQLNDDVELTCNQYLNDLARFQQTWFTDLMWEQETIDVNNYSEEEQADEISGFYTDEQFSEFDRATQVQLICEAIFECNLSFHPYEND